MKVLITGASSFIGKALIRKLVELKWDITAVIRPNSQYLYYWSDYDNVNVIELDLEDYHKIGKYWKDGDVAIMLAWNGTRGDSRNDAVLQKSNYLYNFEAIKSLIRNGCKKIMTAGSQAEYGPHNGIIDEEMKCSPNTEYGKWKLKLYEDSQKVCSENKVKFIEPRFFSLYGPGDYENTMIMSMIKNMHNNKPCNLTECRQLWDYLYLDDAIEAVVKLCYMCCAEGAYNLGSGDTRILKDYVEELHKIMESKSELCYGEVAYPKTGMVSICPNVERAKKQLDWCAKVSFEQGIKRIIKYMEGSLDERTS